ncbi:hypothetical protein [Maribacter sp. LLG6340-A2]|uniref:hypothetical protein n=1 Tax=Maribacter sp. LLG6340-A2 TaxID=3160834 RepID=UPI0038698694
MKERPVLFFAIILSIIVEVILMVLVYDKIGGERLPVQIGRFLFQLVCVFLILTNKSNTALFLLAAYHIVSGLFGLYSSESTEPLGQIFIAYHFIIGLIIYFHDWIESKIGIKNVG